MVSADTRATARRTLVVIGLVLATVVLLYLVMHTARVLVWMVVAAFFAVALHPAVSWLERRIRWCPRWLATLVLFLAVALVVAGLGTLFVVPLVREGTQLYDEFPRIIADVRAGRGPIGHLAERFHVISYLESHSDQIRQYAGSLGTSSLGILRGAATTVVGIVTIFVLAYLMVLQAPKIVDGFLGLFAPLTAERIRRVGNDCARTITGYLTGNLLISLICGLLTYVVLLVLGVPFAGLIALFVGIADLIPLVGATLGALVAALAAFTDSATSGIVVIIFFVVYQQLENHLLQPMIFARTVQLNPLAVLVAILIAGELAGILGALLAIPVAAMIQIVARDLWHGRRGHLEQPTPEAPTEGLRSP